jgi:3-oxoadipate enol-lactonase
MAGAPPATAELFVREVGEGAPVLLVHGMGGDHTVWNGVLPSLGERFRVLAPDLRGHGRSPTPDGSTFLLDELTQDLEVLLSRRGIDSVHLVGMSAGGFLALKWAIERPEKLRSVALVSTAAQCDGHTRAIAQHWAEVYRDQGYDAYVMRMLKDLYYPEWLEQHLDVIDQALESMRNRDLRGAVQWGLSLRTFDVRAQLGRIRVPTTVAHGMDDRVIDPSHARLVRQAIPGTDLKLYPYVGHMLPVERPDEVGALLADWVGRQEKARSAPAGA